MKFRSPHVFLAVLCAVIIAVGAGFILINFRTIEPQTAQTSGQNGCPNSMSQVFLAGLYNQKFGKASPYVSITTTLTPPQKQALIDKTIKTAKEQAIKQLDAEIEKYRKVCVTPSYYGQPAPGKVTVKNHQKEVQSKCTDVYRNQSTLLVGISCNYEVSAFAVCCG